MLHLFPPPPHTGLDPSNPPSRSGPPSGLNPSNCFFPYPPPGLDPSNYHSAPVAQDAIGSVDDVGGGGGVSDPFEGTQGLALRCNKCGQVEVLTGDVVRCVV